MLIKEALAHSSCTTCTALVRNIRTQPRVPRADGRWLAGSGQVMHVDMQLSAILGAAPHLRHKSTCRRDLSGEGHTIGSNIELPFTLFSIHTVVPTDLFGACLKAWVRF
jgi:hypothetical protein